MIKPHIRKVEEALSGAPNLKAIKAAASVITTVRDSGGMVWAVGNGGSAAIAQHFAQDLLKACGIRAQALNDVSVITAYSNDVAFSKCYEAPLKALWRQGLDAIFIFSCSGKSRNVESLAHIFSPCVAIVGTDGGTLAKDSDIHIHVRSEEYDVCETAFSVVSDLLVREVFKKRSYKRRKSK